MCGRYSLASPDPARLRERFAIGDDVPVRARYNVAPGDDVLTVTTDREGAPRGELLRWGLVPYWAKDPKTLGLKLINARSETMLTNGAFRDARALPGHRRRLLRVGEAPGRAQAAVVGHAPRPRAVRLRRAVVELAPGATASSRCAASRSSPPPPPSSSPTCTTACR